MHDQQLCQATCDSTRTAASTVQLANTQLFQKANLSRNGLLLMRALETSQRERANATPTTDPPATSAAGNGACRHSSVKLRVERLAPGAGTLRNADRCA